MNDGKIPVTKEIRYSNVQLAVQRNDLDSGKTLVIIDPAAGAAHIVPLNDDVAKEIGSALVSERVVLPSPEERKKVLEA